MKLFKRIIAVAASSVIVVTSFSGCSAIFGGFNSNRCTQHNSAKVEYDENRHYYVCTDCGERHDPAEHTMKLSHSEDNKAQHFMKCQYCEYKTSYEPHEFREWNYNHTYSVRQCNDCGFIDKCVHTDSKYVVADDYHYEYCDYCERQVTDNKNHKFVAYDDITETTHSVVCICGQKQDENVPHDYKLKATKEGFHADVCSCGFMINEKAHSYSKLLSNGERHYTICSCGSYGILQKHTFELTPERKRMCTVCKCSDRLVYQLIGTWEVSYNFIVTKKQKVTLSSDWSYVVRDYDGKVLAQGDYYFSRYELNDNDDHVGQIVFSGYESKPLSFKMYKRFTSYFTDSAARIYTKV